MILGCRVLILCSGVRV
jgi:xylem cysteine proteinase